MRRLFGWRRSLSFRLVITIIIAETALVTLVNFATLLLFDAPGDLAGLAATDALADSIVTDAAGRAVISPNTLLRHLRAHNPTLRVGAIDPVTRAEAVGSDPGMIDVLRVLNANNLTPTNFSIDVAGDAHPDLALIVYADKWVWWEVPTAILGYLHHSILWIVSIGAGLSLPLVAVVMLSLRPLRRAASLAERLTLRTLDGRVPEQAMPREVLPFVRSINGVLDRLDADVSRQRRFIANAAHELRTPISVLKARIDSLPASPVKSDLTDDAGRIVKLVHQLLTIARMGDVALPLDQEIEIVAEVRNIIADYAPIAIDRGRDLAFKTHEPAVWIKGNLQAFHSALFNVIDNALRAEPVGGMVEIVVGPGPTVSITDHGPGVDPDDAVRLFEPFWRKNASEPGSGLGLPIVHECMRLHRGHVEVDSRPGHGATFRLDFSADREGAISARG